MSEGKGSARVQPTLFQNLCAGAVAGVIGATTVFPIDMAKTRLQNQVVAADGSRQYSGMLDCIKKMRATEGFRAMYRGLAPNLVGIIPEKAIKMAANDKFRELLRSPNDTGELPIHKGVMAGAMAGTCQVVATNPMEIVKINMQIRGMQGLPAQSPLEYVNSVGVKGLYKGTACTLMRDVPFSMVFFSVSAIIRNKLAGNREPKFYESFTAGITAGMFAAYISTPADVIKTRLQATPQPGAMTYDGIPDTVSKIVKNEGASALFKGAVPRMGIIAPLFGIVLMVYEVQKNIIQSYHNNKN